MENLDIIVLTSVVSTLFLVFGIVVYREFRNMEKTDWIDSNIGQQRGPRADFVNFIGKMISEKNTKDFEKDELKSVYKTLERTISDMETDGMYFTPEVKKDLKEKLEKLNCHYSGLPGVESYSKDETANPI